MKTMRATNRQFPKSFITGLIVLLFFTNAISQNISDSIYHNGMFRTYQIYIPPLYNPAQSTPLVFVLHGGGGNAEYMSAYTQFNLTADTANFIVVYPEGIYVGINVGGQPGHEWADGRMVLLPDSLGIDDVDFISHLIDTLSLNYNICSSCIFATGISNGGIMCQRMASQLSNKLAAVASVAASFPDSLLSGFNPSHPISILFMNGTNDPITPVISGGIGLAGGSNISTDSAIALWVNHNLCLPTIDSTTLPNTSLLDLSTVTKYTYSFCRDSTEILFYKINNGGHTWPQENDTLHVPFTGACNHDFNGSSEIWNFFRTHCKKQTTSIADFISPNNSKIIIYLNPASGNIYIYSDFKIENISIYNIHGECIQKHHDGNFTVSKLASGIYIIAIQTEESSFLSKFIK
jgi:polyhydroxybutyrate depolymerase